MHILTKTDSFIIMTDIPTPEEVAKRTGRGSVIQKQWAMYLESEFRPFTPLVTSMLQKSATLHSDFGAGQIVYNTPYAKRLYYSPHFKFTKDHNVNAGAYWDRRAAMQRRDNFWKPYYANLMTKAITGGK